MVRDPKDENTEYFSGGNSENDAAGHIRGNFVNNQGEVRATTTLGVGGIAMIIVLLLAMMLCFCGLIYYL